MTDTETTARIAEIAQDAIDAATEYGTRAWFPGNEPKLTDNAFGGVDIRQGQTTYRLAEDDTMIQLYVFTGGTAMLLSEQATFTPGLAHLAGAFIAEALR